MHSCTNHATWPTSSHCIRFLKLDMGRPAKRNLVSWCSRMKTTSVLRHLWVPQNPHLTIFCTYNKTFHCEVILHACQSTLCCAHTPFQIIHYRKLDLQSPVAQPSLGHYIFLWTTELAVGPNHNAHRSNGHSVRLFLFTSEIVMDHKQISDMLPTSRALWHKTPAQL
jgi:hypothetical protein